MKIICFEGINGCGKSTIIKMLKQYFEEKEYSVCTVVNPGTTKLGELIRPIARQVDELIDPLVQLFLFCATKTHLVKTILEDPDHNSMYDICLMDRFWLSTYVYQVIIGKCDYGLFVKAFMQTYFIPELLILIDADPEKSLVRAKGDSGFEQLEIVKQARQGYLTAVRDLEIFGGKHVVLDHESLNVLVEQSKNVIEQVLDI